MTLHHVNRMESRDDHYGDFRPACTCGWQLAQPVTSMEAAIDALMDHAAESAAG